MFSGTVDSFLFLLHWGRVWWQWVPQGKDTYVPSKMKQAVSPAQRTAWENRRRDPRTAATVVIELKTPRTTYAEVASQLRTTPAEVKSILAPALPADVAHLLGELVQTRQKSCFAYLCAAITARGWNQTDIATAAGTSRQYVSAVARGPQAQPFTLPPIPHKPDRKPVPRPTRRRVSSVQSGDERRIRELAENYRHYRDTGSPAQRRAAERDLVTVALDLSRRHPLTLAQISTIAGMNRMTLPQIAERVTGVQYLPDCRTTIRRSA